MALGKTSAQRLARKPKLGSGGKRTAKRVEFELAHGGLVSRTHMDSDSGGFQEPQVSIHPTVDHAKTHLARALGHAFPKSG